MDTWFLFTKHLDDTGCICLCINQDGELKAPPDLRTFSELRQLQKECHTLIIEACENASILDLELPWLPERKARVAIPFALEDKLAQPIEELHFAFDKQRYHNNHYSIVVISKQRIRYIMELLTKNNIEFDAITLDWFALAPQEMCISNSTVLINNKDFKGALSEDLAPAYLDSHPLSPLFIFQDSQITSNSSSKIESHSYTWIAQRILPSKPMNLCQGTKQHGNKSDWIKKGYQLAGILCGVWLVSVLLVNALSLYTLNKQSREIDQQIAHIYHQFFPDAKQVINPRFRISQLAGTNESANQTHFWFILNQFTKALKDNPFTIEHLGYQNKNFSVTLLSTDFARLERFENKLKALQLKVKQTQASTKDQHVVATLELM